MESETPTSVFSKPSKLVIYVITALKGIAKFLKR